MTLTRTLLGSLLALALTAPAAHASVWDRALDGPKAQLVQTEYDKALTDADDAALAANSRSASLAQVKESIDKAVALYREASKLRPKSPEPYYRLGALLHSFYFDCNQFSWQPATCHAGARNDAQAREIVDAWDKFEARAPLDPRVNEILLDRAILRTKLVEARPNDKTLLEAALRDYRTLLDRMDGLYQRSSALVLGNLAETYMMLGRLDEAIDAYKDAIRSGAGTSTIYGLAVALDRDERTAQAMSLIRDQGIEEYISFQAAFSDHQVFYVPDGEEYYYFALIEEAFGNIDAAIEHWKSFIKSGAHPQFQPRAKAHLDTLLSKRNLRWRPPIDPLRGM
ncbi:MAG TPA: tetratricopeptide repeat protein [Kofleriaceae bacterium]|nr:tetratricopeptide repeat protein [Kofleriaceae bacterium]